MKTMRRSRSGRFTRSARPVRSVRRRSTRRVSRRVRTNPPKMTPAMRKKISLAVKRSFRNRKSSPVKSVSRRRKSVSVARRSSSISPAIRRKISMGVRRANRSGASRRSFGSSGSLIKSGKGIFGMVSKDTLMIAGGAVAASFGTGIILAKFGSKLPGMTSANPKTAEYARAAYSVAIPLGAAYLLRNKNRRIAEGLVIGGLIMGFNSLLRSFAPTATVVAQGPMGNFYETSGARGMGLAGEVPLGLGEYVNGANPGTLSNDLSTAAFPDSAW